MQSKASSPQQPQQHHYNIIMAITVVSTPQAKTSTAQAATASKKRRMVSFDESVNRSYTNSTWTFEECAKSWYSNLDYQRIKETAKGLAKHIYKKERHANNANNNVLLQVYDACCDNVDAIDHAALRQYLSTAHYRTGLEKMYARELAYDKKQRRHQMNTVVKVAQEQRQPAIVVGKACATVSLPARTFAHVMATALYQSLYCWNNNKATSKAT